MNIELLAQISFLSALGGMVFALVVNNILPFFGIPKVSIKRAAAVIATIATVFWTSWIIPISGLMIVTNNGGGFMVTAILSGLFIIFIVTATITTYLLGKKAGAPNG